MRLFPRLNHRVLAVFSIVALPILFVAAAVAFGLGQAGIRATFGEHLIAAAEQTAGTVDRFVFRRVMDASKTARVPTLREAAAAASRMPFDAATVRQLDELWLSQPTVPTPLLNVLTSPAAEYLAQLSQLDPIFREILLTDRYGRLVAASGRTTDYYQADEPWWTEAYGDGVHGRVRVSDVAWDESADVDAFRITTPVLGSSGNEVVGLLQVVIDARELGALIGGSRVGRTGGAAILRPDGSFVFAAGGFAPKATFFAEDLLRENLGKVRPGGLLPGFSFQAQDADGRPYLVAVGRSQLQSSYSELKWVVATYQLESELFAPVRAQAWYMATALAFVALTVFTVALWFSQTLATSRIHDDLHLIDHPRTTGFDEQSSEVAATPPVDLRGVDELSHRGSETKTH
jgi:hypothetical protein